MPAYFYILYSPAFDKFYLGHTQDALDERLRRHVSKHKGFTGKTNDWKVVYYETFETKGLAYARERQVKSWKSRAKIEQLVAGS